MGTGVTLTRSAITFSKKQQISKGEYKRTQQAAAHLHRRNGEIRYNAWSMWSSGYFAEIAIFDARLLSEREFSGQSGGVHQP
jgi:hypothetical protein